MRTCQPTLSVFMGSPRARLIVAGLISAASVLLPARQSAYADAGDASGSALKSVYTELTGKSCRKFIDESDPNDTPHLACKGVAGYKLILRRVDAGRVSVDVVDSAEREFPLEYQEVVTPHMFSLGGKAEWRVAMVNGKTTPVGLIVPVHAREDDEDPDKVTNTYLVVAKISPGSMCVTDRIIGGKARTAARHAADTAHQRDCLPPVAPDGTVR